jgi:hypothetical protein
VKGRHFVLALNDYFAEKVRTAEAQASAAVTTIHTRSPSPVPSIVASDVAIGDVVLNSAFAENQAKKANEDVWALAYINLLHVQPLLEAFDDDGTGYLLPPSFGNVLTALK